MSFGRAGASSNSRKKVIIVVYCSTAAQRVAPALVNAAGVTSPRWAFEGNHPAHTHTPTRTVLSDDRRARSKQ